MKSNVVLILSLFIIIGCTKRIPEQTQKFSNLRGDYLGQQQPGDIPQLFAPGIVSTGLNERDAAFSPDQTEFYFSIWQNGKGTLLFMKREDEKWTSPEVIPFSGVYNDIEPFITYDGSKIFFASNRPVEGKDPIDYNIWYSERNSEGQWIDPIILDSAVNSQANEFYPTLTENGDLYFTAANDKSIGGEDIFVSRYVDGVYQPYENLGDSVNSVKEEFNSFIAKDGSYLLYTTTGFGDGLGGGDLWVCFKKEDNSWTRPKNLGEINSNKLDYCPSITPDGKFLFFTSNRVLDRNYEDQVLYEQIVREFNNPMNGSGDIYWVNTEVMQKLK